LPLFYQNKPQPEVHIGLWKIEEDEGFFRSNMSLSMAEEADLAPLKGTRRLEWLACRWLLHELSGHDIRMPLAKDAYSKPFFEGNEENRHCSLTHSGGFVGAVIAAEPCGCDLEGVDKRLQRVSSKFINESEQKLLDNPPFAKDKLWLLCYIWCAKEAMYKAYGAKEVDFKKHLTVDYQGVTRVENGKLHKEDFQQQYQLHYMDVQNETLIFLWCINKSKK
jgi:4'-phosphopantetheinyl transferase